MEKGKKRKASKGKLRRYIYSLRDEYRNNRKTFILYMLLRSLVLITLVLSILTQNYESSAICILSLFLFLIPAFLEKRMKIVVPELLQGIVFLFIFAAEILGEVNHFFVLIPGWDTMLHTCNGFLCAAIGFSLINLLNENSDKLNLSPFYLTMVAFCFSMTIGVVWEFFECTMDLFFQRDMQKDFIISAFSSMSLDPAGAGSRIRVDDIARTVIETASGQTYVVEGGYLDIGILDTMKDLFVNFIGAVVFSFIGYYSLKGRKKSAIANALMLTKASDNPSTDYSDKNGNAPEKSMVKAD